MKQFNCLRFFFYYYLTLFLPPARIAKDRNAQGPTRRRKQKEQGIDMFKDRKREGPKR